MTFPLLETHQQPEFELRISKVKLEMRNAGIEALLVASTTNIFYLSGGIFRGYIYIPVDSSPLIFMIPPAHFEREDVVEIRKPEQIPALLAERGIEVPGKVGLEFDDLYYSDVTRLASLFAESKVMNESLALRAARMIKTSREIEMMKQDGMHQCAVYARVPHCYKEDMTDVEFQTEIERVMRSEGCLGFLRAAGARMEINMGSLLAGPNADQPSPYDFSMGGAGVDPSLPVGASGLIMKHGMAVMVDMNGGFNGYQTDMTRCWSIGTLPDIAMKAHECSRKILRRLEEISLPGVEISRMWHEAMEIVREEGLESYYMGHHHKVAFIGHGVGIELNEGPVIMERNKSLLQEGMTIALEPKFVIPEVGAVGVENTYLVTPDGLQNLTPFSEELDSLL